MIDFGRLNAYNIIGNFAYLCRLLWVKFVKIITVKQTAEKCNLSERRLQTMCNEGKIPGVKKFGNAWGNTI